MDGTELQTPQAPATAPLTPQVPYPQFSPLEPQPTQQGGWTAWAQSQLGQMFQRQGPQQPTPSAPPLESSPTGSDRQSPAPSDSLAANLSTEELELLSEWRKQGATLTDVNNQLLIRQSLPPNMQTPEVLEGIMDAAADDPALIAALSTPEGIERFVNAYNQEQDPTRYDTGIPASGGSMDSLDSAWSYLSQPNMPAHAAALLQQPPNFWRGFALAGGDWNPESGTVARSIR